MTLPEEPDFRLSQLVDQELPVDEACEVLLEVLDDAEARQRLRAMLQLRHAFRGWRQQEPRGAVVALPSAQPAGSADQAHGRLVSLAAAALLGGVLVTAGFLLGGRFHGETPVASTAPPSPAAEPRPQAAPGEDARPTVIVTPDERREIARAFALHESVAGPLRWYAADDATIQVSPAANREEQPLPIAVVLRLSPAKACKGGQAKTYVIVCRNNDPAAIELPESEVARNVSFRLFPTVADSRVSLQYAISTDGSAHGAGAAALVGRRHVGLHQTSLGQLALDDCLVNVDASSWVIQNERQP